MASELRVDKIVPTDGVPTGGGGGIVQVKQSLYNTYSSSNTNTSMSAISGWTVVITPKFNTSKMFVTVNISVECRSSNICLLYTSPSPRDATLSRMPSSA